MDKRFDFTTQEQKIYSFWEENNFFKAKVDPSKKPFCIIAPPPNANADLHLGHAMYVYEDIMIRYNKLIGNQAFWVAGMDHAGFETQFVFEKHLRKQNKSRFDYDRDTLYKMIWNFVEENKPRMRTQLKRLGFALDWSKEQYTIDPHTITIVYDTFKKLFDAGLLYRKNRLVNYCVRDGTSFSDLEVDYQEKTTNLWYIRYPLKDDPTEYITVATTRPETMLGDTGVAVNPKDKRYADFVGKTVVLPIMNREIPVIADDMVDPKFGTGAVKMTPAHDENDWQVAQRHNLEMIQVIGFNGKMTKEAGKYEGMKAAAAREQVVKELESLGLLEKTKEYTHRVGVCYKCGSIIEPLPLEQWFITVKPLADNAIKLIEEERVTFYPKKYKKQAIQILENFIDWNISRQVVWGIRIPAFQNKKTGEWSVEIDPKKQSELINSGEYEQDNDTFDTWFSSGQWPYATLKNIGEDYFNYFYPTSVMETGHDILRAWVVRMMMLGYFATGKEPFKHVFLHGMVRDKHGQKMSKSKGNVINPIEFMDKYGADALRAALIFGTKDGGDTSISEEKVIGMRNFANKIWNIGRFLWMGVNPQEENTASARELQYKLTIEDKNNLKALQKEARDIEKQYKKHMEKDQFGKAFDLTYHFLWHSFADIYIEKLKDAIKNGNKEALEILLTIFKETLVMLHPFIPFVTEAVWQAFHGENESILKTSQ